MHFVFLFFFCSLHALVHMADTSSKALLEFEKDTGFSVTAHTFKTDIEPGSIRLVRTVCKEEMKIMDTL